MPRPAPLNPIDKHIGARIKMRRNDLKISQQSLAAWLNISFQQIQKYEKAMNRVSASRLVARAICRQGAIAEFTASDLETFVDDAWRLDAPLARAAIAEATAWQPIETAPRDGTKIDLLFPYPRGRAEGLSMA